MGSPIRTSRDHCFFASFSVLFAGLHVLLRLSSPRHPPDALIHLTLSFEEPFDFISIGVDNQPYLDSLIWQSLLLCCVLFLPFVFQEQLIQSSPKFLWFVYFFFQYQHLFQAAWNAVAPAFQTNPNFCLCVLISAFQFVKDRCVVSQIKTILNFKIF